jgi:hypothetical protein
MLFLEYQILNVKNVVSFFCDASEEDVASKLLEAKRLMDQYHMKRNGKTVISMCEGRQKILIPLDCEPKRRPDEWEFKKLIHLENAIRTRHEGAYSKLLASVEALNSYVSKRGLVAITGNYCQFAREWASVNDISNSIIDIYVGVSCNVL